jgi:pilus assembly protein CpaD
MLYNRKEAMTKTQKAHFSLLSITRVSLWAGAGLAFLVSAGCGGGYSARREAPPQDAVLNASLKRTVLEAHTPTAIAVEARLVLGAAQGAKGITGEDYSQLLAFATDFVRLGRGNMVMSIPANSSNGAAAMVLAQDARRALYAGGVDDAQIASGSYDAQGRPEAPILLSFERYEAQKIACKPWAEMDARKTASNLSPDRFGCAQNANLAAMVSDPGDLLGDRRDGPSEAARLQVGVEKLRKGEIPVVSGSVAGGGQ